MKCPHCLVEYYSQKGSAQLGLDSEYRWSIMHENCPSCEKKIIWLCSISKTTFYEERLVYPKAINRSPLPDGIPETLANDYSEACLVLADSPKASAALSRRCLQQLLRNHAGVKPGDLAKEIQQVIDQDDLPSYIAVSLDAVRNVGNFAAHPNKSLKTGEIIDVEPGEAEWTLDVLEELFDFYFVKPKTVQAKRDKLNEKLREAGKPEMK